MATIDHSAFPLRLRARDGEETAAMEAVLGAFRAMRARQRVAGPAQVSQTTKAAQADVTVHVQDVLHDLIEVKSLTAYLCLIQQALDGIPDDARCVERIWGMTMLLASIAVAGGCDLVNQASGPRLAAGGRIHSDLSAVRTLVNSVCDDLPPNFLSENLAPGSALGDVAGLLRRLLTEDTADAVAMAPGQGMHDLLGAVFQHKDAGVIEMFRSGVMIPEQAEEEQRLRQELARLLAKQDHLLSREIRTVRWTLVPLAGCGETRPAKVESDRDFLEALVYLFRRFASPATSELDDTDGLLLLMYDLGRHPALLRWWLPRSFIPEDGIEFGPIHRRVIETLVTSPRRFLRLNNDPEAIACRRHLRPLVPLFEAYHPTVEQAALLAALRAPESSLGHVLDLMASYLRTRVQADTTVEVMSFLGAGVKRLLDESATAIEGTVLVSRFPHLRTAEDVALDQLIAEEAASAPLVEVPIVPSPLEPLPAELEWETAPASEDSKPVVFELVENPGGSRTRSVRLTTTRAGMVDALSEFIDSHGERIEPPRSVARAIYHYLYELPESVRNTWNKETLNGFSWHKLKRGRCRIYIRIVGETVCFSLINRRDWVHRDRGNMLKPARCP